MARAEMPCWAMPASPLPIPGNFMRIKDYIRQVPDFPKPGILFYDITTLLKQPEAFREVNDMTIHVAEEQAALRASIAEMFVNVARRNHVLLSRQLSFIDQLERSEENPDTLDNLFRLDHLATRMRRNAESLIVLAGIDAGRRLRRPMPLSDVIRTAVSEIERYDRVDLALQADPPMVGHVALTTAHLLAELLENATQFSNPDTRVISSTAFSPRGVRITITDLGLGIVHTLDMEAAAGFLGRGESVELLVVDVDDRLALAADQVMVGFHVDVVAGLVVERIDLHDDAQRLEGLEVLVDRVERDRGIPLAHGVVDDFGGRVHVAIRDEAGADWDRTRS